MGSKDIIKTTAVEKVETVEAKPIQVWDDALGDFQEVSIEKQSKAEAALRLLNQLDLIKAFVIKMVHDEKLYSGIGCSSFQDFIDRKLSFGKTKAYEYLKVANTYLPNFTHVLVDGKISPKEIDKLSVRTANETSSARTDEQDFLLSRTFKELLGGSEEVDFAEVDEPNVGARKLTELKEKSTSKISILTEELKLAKKERDEYKKGFAEAMERIERIEESEMLFGPMATKLDEKKRLMSTARDMLGAVDTIVAKLGITIEDPASVIKDLYDLVRRYQWGFAQIAENHSFMISLFDKYDTANARSLIDPEHAGKLDKVQKEIQADEQSLDDSISKLKGKSQ